MAANPNLIGGGRLTRAEVSGDKRRFEGTTLSKGTLLRRLWRYLGRNRALLVLALILGAAARYIYRAKKKGHKCIGCPHSSTCSGSCGSGKFD